MAKISDTEQLIWQQTQTINDLRAQLAAAERALETSREMYTACREDRKVERERAERAEADVRRQALEWLSLDGQAAELETFNDRLTARIGRLERLVRVLWKSRREWQETAEYWLKDSGLTFQAMVDASSSADVAKMGWKEAEARIAKVRDYIDTYEGASTIGVLYILNGGDK